MSEGVEDFRQLSRDRRAQAGFTLIELLVVVAILGILTGVAVVGVGQLMERARIVTIDATLDVMTTAVEGKQMILEDEDNLLLLLASGIDVKNADSYEFMSVNPDPSHVTVLARHKGTESPCRQIQFPEPAADEPKPCEPIPVGAKVSGGGVGCFRWFPQDPSPPDNSHERPECTWEP